MKRLENTTESGFSTRIAPTLMQNAGEARMHKSLLNIGMAAVLVLLLVCCGAAAGAATVTTPAELTSAVEADFDVILDADIKLESTLSISKTGTLDLNGHVLNISSGSVITINSGGNLTLKDSRPREKHMFSVEDGGLWKLNNSGDESIYGGVITNGSADNGGGVYVNDGMFTMMGGNIIGNSASKGGGVYVNDGMFTMMGGNIIGNSASRGGGVYVANSGIFTMDDGSIAGNSATTGGGVLNTGTFNMFDGSITKNNATTNGGGVLNTGTFNMFDGSITKNNAMTNGGGVWSSSTFKVSGSPEISGNTKGDGTNANNVYLWSTKYITVTGALQLGAYIGIINPLIKDAQFGQNDGSYTITDADAAFFHPDSGELIAKTNGSTLKWAEKSPVAKIGTTNYSTVADAVAAAESGAIIEMIADSTEATVTVNKTVTLNLAGFVLNNTGSGSVIQINSEGNLTVTDSGSTKHYFKYKPSAAWEATTDTAGAKPLSEFNRSTAQENDIFYVEGGVITGDSAPTNGGGVYVNGGKFTMSGGNIVGNSPYLNGGGVYVTSSGTFTMTGGNIAGNSAPTAIMMSSGGGVSVSGSGSNFEMSGGSIIGNSAINGGGVYVYDGMIMMSGGNISGNSATTNGGGVHVSSGTFKVKDAPVIKENKKGTDANNVNLNTGKYVTLTGALQSGAYIGIINPLIKDAQFGQNDGSYTITDADAAFFHPDSGELIAKTDGSTLKWAEKTPVAKIGTTNYSTVADAVAAAESGATIEMIADSTEATVTVDKQITLDLAGFVLSNTGSGSVIKVVDGGNLTLMDSGSTAHYFKFVDDSPWTLETTKPADNLIHSLSDFNRTEAKASNEYYIEVTGGVITGGNVGNQCGGGVYVFAESNGYSTFTMNGGNIIGNKETTGIENGAASGGVYVYANSNGCSTFTMNGGSIAGNIIQHSGGGGVMISRYGASETSSFTMNGGDIIGNTATQRGGGGVDAWSGEFNMTGGNITGNHATKDGGGVYVNAGACTFEMSGTANIKGNTATQNGGGVFVTDSTYEVTMSGGNITGNTATEYGGGVFVESGTFNMTGGTIGGTEGKGNTATNGGGVYIDSGTFTMSGTASITENTASGNGGGVFMAAGTFNVSGMPVISGNTKNGAANNVYLRSLKYITVINALQSGADIGIINESDADAFARGYSGYTVTVNDAQYFHHDTITTLAAKVADTTKTGEESQLVWAAKVTVTFDTQGHGTQISPVSIGKGSTVPKPADPTADGYTFGGWYNETACTNAWDFANNTVTADTTLHAKWTANPQPVPPSTSSSSSRNYGASIWLTATPTPTPTAEATPEPTQAQPTASPVKPQQTSTPAPAAGIIAGLGAAALVFGLRRK